MPWFTAITSLLLISSCVMSFIARISQPSNRGAYLYKRKMVKQQTTLSIKDIMINEDVSNNKLASQFCFMVPSLVPICWNGHDILLWSCLHFQLQACQDLILQETNDIYQDQISNYVIATIAIFWSSMVYITQSAMSLVRLITIPSSRSCISCPFVICICYGSHTGKGIKLVPH